MTFYLYYKRNFKKDTIEVVFLEQTLLMRLVQMPDAKALALQQPLEKVATV